MKPKYKLTKLEKLQMHRLMWLWLSEDESRTKSGWHIGLRWANDCYYDEEGRATDGMIEYPLCGCFLCALFQNNQLKCVKCPLYQLSGGFCEEGGPFAAWRAEINRAKNARRIAHCADKLIKEMEARNERD